MRLPNRHVIWYPFFYSVYFLIEKLIIYWKLQTVYRQCKVNNVTSTTTEIFHNVSSESLSTCEEPWTNLPERVFTNLWRTVYWSTQFLTWLIMPMMQSYIKAGDFTIRGKMKSALFDNAIYYGSYLLICGILLIYLALKGIHLDW